MMLDFLIVALIVATAGAGTKAADSLQTRPALPAATSPARAPSATQPPPSPSPAAPKPAPAASARTGAPQPVPLYWQTRAEKSSYRVTPDYDETMRYCRQLEAGSEWIKVVSYGVSGQGRPQPLMIVSKDRAFTPEAARATGKPIILIQNGIHSGEIEGKDASLALVRDLAVLRTREPLLDHAILLVLPIFSVDAHERRSRFNRINQNGPQEMGWRFTPIGLNLNRDYLKVETPEMHALITKVFTRWWPHLLVDNHTTDGADFRHDVTYGINFGIGVPAPIDHWVTCAFEGRVVPRLGEMGHLPAPYLTFRRGADPRNGVEMNNSPPRFSTGYAPLQCRPGILVETHMLKPYETRVRATYDLMVALLEEINAHPDSLIGAVAASEAQVIALARATSMAARRAVLSTHDTESSLPFEFKGKQTRWEMSEITGAPVPHYTNAPWDTIIPLYRELAPTLEVTVPPGYLVPQEWSGAVVDPLETHAVHFRRFAKAWSDTVEVQHILEWSAAQRSSEGHHPISVTRVALERRVRAFRPGDLWVPCDQRSGMIAVHLFEAQAPDGLMYWNAFDTVFEFKEYAEDYVMEPIARDMMLKDVTLAREFRSRVAADTAFAHNPGARSDFFYRRSPWADPEQNLDPVLRALRPPPESVLAPQ